MATRKLSVRERRIRKGEDVALEPLRQQAAVAISLSLEKAANLALKGWIADRHDRLVEVHQLLGTARFVQLESRFDAAEATRTQNQTVDEAKVFKRDLDGSLTNLFLNHDELPVREEDFQVGPVRLGRSPANYAAYFEKIFPPLSRVDHLLLPMFAGESPAARAAELAARLRHTDAVQERKREALPADTQELCLLKGELLDLIEELNRAGRRAEEGDAAQSARFNKDLILAARKRRRKAQPDEQPSASHERLPA